MTIKRYSRFGFPFSNKKAEVTTTVKPGLPEFLVFCHPDLIGEGFYRGILAVTALDSERVKRTILAKDHVVGENIETVVGLLQFPKPTDILEGIEIRGITDEINGGYTKSLLGEDVVIYHEPTLPQQARK